MGVPSLFRTIASKHPETHYWDASCETDHLFFDFNCLIHHAKTFTELKAGMSLRDIEEEVISSIIRYTSKIISTIKPKKLVYIAIDGPVPMGKIVRQRARRYKKVVDTEFDYKLKKKYQIEKTPFFDSNKITPGTPFMSKLCNRIKNFIKLGTFNKHSKDCNIFFSDANVPGEGEHKIMDFIRNGKGNPSIVIYGLDADLIILAMNLQKQKIKLLREPQNTSVEIAQYHDSQLLYFDIDKTKECLIKHYDLKSYDSNRVINDFVFISNFGGNDFCDAFCFTKIRENGMETLFNTYRKCDGYLTEGNKVNFSVFKQFLTLLAEREDHIIKQKWNNRSFHKNGIVLKDNTEKYKHELSNYEHSLYIDYSNPMNKMYSKKANCINYNQEHSKWKQDYNECFFGNNEIYDICREYIKTIIWTFNYYHNNVLSWTYYYPYNNAPCATDLINVLDESMFEIDFQVGEPLPPLAQLLIVTPPQNIGLLPFSHMAFFNANPEVFAEYFPKTFELDVVKGQKNIYSEPILPPINLEVVNKILYSVAISEPETVRNTIKSRPFLFKNN